MTPKIFSRKLIHDPGALYGIRAAGPVEIQHKSPVTQHLWGRYCDCRSCVVRIQGGDFGSGTFWVYPGGDIGERVPQGTG